MIRGFFSYFFSSVEPQNNLQTDIDHINDEDDVDMNENVVEEEESGQEDEFVVETENDDTQEDDDTQENDDTQEDDDTDDVSCEDDTDDDHYNECLIQSVLHYDKQRQQFFEHFMFFGFSTFFFLAMASLFAKLPN
jgi:hypothetical protein